MKHAYITLYHVVFHDESSLYIKKASIYDVLEVFGGDSIKSITVLGKERAL